MKIETVTVMISVLCFAASIYLAILSSQVYEIRLKAKLVDWSVFTLIGGITILLCWLFVIIIKGLFQGNRTEEEEGIIRVKMDV